MSSLSESRSHDLLERLEAETDASMSFTHSTGGERDLMVFIDDEDLEAAAEEWIAEHLDAIDDDLYHDTHIVELPSAKAGVHIQTTPVE